MGGSAGMFLDGSSIEHLTSDLMPLLIRQAVPVHGLEVGDPCYKGI